MNHFPPDSFCLLSLSQQLEANYDNKIKYFPPIRNFHHVGRWSALTMKDSLCVYWFCCCYFLFVGIYLWAHRLCIPPVSVCKEASWYWISEFFWDNNHMTLWGNKPDCSERNLDSLEEQSALSYTEPILRHLCY